MKTSISNIPIYNILLVEDNPGDAKLIDIYLKEIKNVKFELYNCETIKSTLSFISKNKNIDLIILDLNLPDSRGLVSFDKLSEKASDIPVIVLTGLDDEETALNAVQKGAQDYLVKDKVESEILNKTIRYAIERKHLAEEKQKLLEQQTRTTAIIEAQENERRRMSREIHDGLGQLLSAAKLNFGMLDMIKDNPDKVDDTIKQIETLINRAIVEARRISHDLRPATLDDFGLIPSLRIISQDFSKLTGVKVLYQVSNFNDRINPKAEIAIFRIVQEAFNNIMKYAKAKEVSLDIYKNGKSVQVKVKDDGIGFDMKKVEKHKNTTGGGLGLLNMRERANMVGGKFDINSAPLKGTELTVEINLDYFK